MLSHEEMVGLQSEKHDLIDTQTFRSKEEYVLHLIHKFAYAQASRLCENKKVLDLGCNTGYGSELLSKSATKVVGVDVSKKAISQAKDQYGHLGIHFQQIDGRELPFADNQFDMITSCQVIEHIVDYGIFISELKRVLAPSGIVFFTTPNALLRLDPGMKPWNKFHVREFTHSELQSVLSAFFAQTRIWGLFAEEPLYSIEANRLDRARKNARRNAKKAGSIRSMIKTIAPGPLTAAIGKFTRSFSYPGLAVDTSFINQHGISDFSYRPNHLDTALDLLAICSDVESSLQEPVHKLTEE
jgi:2-polyprenyl-3-methyl-5-hydroxy-6-metoxy-1,4-benzoquinol methylase